MNFKIFLFIAALILLSPTLLGDEQQLRHFLVVWNVGQGQWATLKNEDGCSHFDMGGEKNPLRKVAKLCRKEKNFLYLSHWDWDHISFVGKSARFLPERCLALRPLGLSRAKKMKLLEPLLPCQANPSKLLTEELAQHEMKNSLTLTSNDRSHVVLAAKRYLIPGDSTIAQEKLWSLRPSLAQTRWLLLGHHGSRTSTSKILLDHLPKLKQAVVSARERRYGHPHVQVTAQLKLRGIPLLRTEDWGHLWFELRSPSRDRPTLDDRCKDCD